MEILDEICTKDLSPSPETPLEVSTPPVAEKPNKALDALEMPQMIKIKRNCAKFVEKYTDEILVTFNKSEQPYKVALCVNRIKACTLKRDEL